MRAIQDSIAQFMQMQTTDNMAYVRKTLTKAGVKFTDTNMLLIYMGWRLREIISPVPGARQFTSNHQPSKHRRPYGEYHIHAVLTEADVILARRMYYTDGMTLKRVAKFFRRSPHTMEDAIHGRTWKHIPDYRGARKVRPSK